MLDDGASTLGTLVSYKYFSKLLKLILIICFASSSQRLSSSAPFGLIIISFRVGFPSGAPQRGHIPPN